MTKLIKRGDIIDVKITGIQPYGAFALLPDSSTGLIHISEISDKFVKSIASYVHINDIVKDTSKEKELTHYIEEKDYDYF